jgi:uncharacterized coiled-coil protein SlyX
MSSLDQRIADLEARLAIYETEYDAATTPEEKQRISGLIKVRAETLSKLLKEKQAQSGDDKTHCDLKSMIEDSHRMLTALFSIQGEALYWMLGVLTRTEKHIILTLKPMCPSLMAALT